MGITAIRLDFPIERDGVINERLKNIVHRSPRVSFSTEKTSRCTTSSSQRHKLSGISRTNPMDRFSTPC